jgi:hypothetical protein
MKAEYLMLRRLKPAFMHSDLFFFQPKVSDYEKLKIKLSKPKGAIYFAPNFVVSDIGSRVSIRPG